MVTRINGSTDSWRIATIKHTYLHTYIPTYTSIPQSILLSLHMCTITKKSINFIINMYQHQLCLYIKNIRNIYICILPT